MKEPEHSQHCSIHPSIGRFKMIYYGFLNQNPFPSNVFYVNWCKWREYALPHFSLVAACLQKISEERVICPGLCDFDKVVCISRFKWNYAAIGF